MLSKLFSSLILLTICCSVNSIYLSDVDFDKTKISGPGLVPNSQLPYHYFYIQLKDKKLGHFLNESIVDEENNLPIEPNEIFKVSIRYDTQDSTSRKGQNLKIRTTSVGKYVVVFNIYGYQKSASIEVKLLQPTKKLLKQGTIKNLSSKECNCPNPNVKNWLKTNNCPRYLKNHQAQLNYDFKKFKNGGKKIDLDLLKQQFKSWQAGSGNSYAVCRYVIKNNEIFRDCAGKHIGFNMFSDEYLITLTKMVKLPDVEFIQNLGDWPLSTKQLNRNLGTNSILPIVSWCGSEETYDIILPTYDYTRTVLQGSLHNDIFGYLHENDFNSQNDNQPQKHSNHLSKKIPKAIWRGRDSRQERLELSKLSKKYPDKLDAGITAFFFFPKDESIFTDRIAMGDFNKYRVIISIDGTVAAYRMPYLLAMSSVILKVKSKYYEHFYRGLEEKLHYFSVKEDLSDVMEKIDYLLDDGDDQDDKDNESKINILQSNTIKARQRALELLEPISVLCYHVEFFKRYSEMMSREVIVHEGMEKIGKKEERFGQACRGCAEGKYGSSTKDEL